MANLWVATDSAESYANGNAIDTLNGGSGWSAAWTVLGAGTKDIINTPTLEGSLCFRLQHTSAQGPEALRAFANITSGVFSIINQQDSNTTAFGFLSIQETGVDKMAIYIDGANDFGLGTGHVVLAGSANTDLGTFSANTNITIVLEFDNATDQARASIDGGTTFSAWKNYSTGAVNINGLRLRGSDGSAGPTYNTYFDDIKPYVAAVATTPSLAPVSISGGISDSGGGMGI